MYMAILRFVLVPIIVILFVNNFIEENYIYMFIGLTLVHWIIGILYYFYSSNKIRNIQSTILHLEDLEQIKHHHILQK